ncbi:glycosyltransferase family 2 protein [Prosthecochloris vibrioformis]|uniref:Glycosyltransferase family 2 protein n=1 Tax=Prosthecochloris vibrioformis TaxID=1098 RepID=A0A5C4RTX3_PROVB|nr:glycosyltransferase family 2 protein [Prosthecochloris vibrioformis]TNJ34067.1 glycosyltransferase family 2 protein [Prosthecochloris vibrioformis]
MPRNWACYRLGLYGTVSGSMYEQARAWKWKEVFAIAVSLAACGRHDEAAKVARLAEARYSSRRDFHMLADALAPFMPEHALELVAGKETPISLQAALLQANGRKQESRQLLEVAFSDGVAVENPELFLYRSNAGSWSIRERLWLLNAYLDGYGIPGVSLHDPCLPAGLHNLVPTGELPSVDNGPLVSILLTTYNSSEHVETAIASVLGQTWRNIELIVIDDASSDDTGDIVKAIMIDDQRVRYIGLPCNVGTYVAKNIGLRYAKGEFVTCHDSDDWSHPLKIERQVMPLLQNRKLICTTSDWVRMQDDGTYYARPVHPLKRFNPSSPLFRRKEVLETTGAWDCVRTGADSEFAARLKIVFGRKAVLRIRQPLAFGAHRPGSLMTDADTGYTAGRVPPDRLDYWESWTWWQINELRAKRKPRMPSMTEARAFKAPEAIVVPQESIEQCMREAALYSPMGVREYAVD